MTRWLEWARRAQAIAQAGLAYSTDPFDRERYQAMRDLSLEIMEAHLDLPDDRARHELERLFALDTGYPTPKVDVRALVGRDGRVLLVRERADGRWSLPGGWADSGSSPSDMAEREVAEEAGITVRAERLLAVWDQDRHHAEPAPVSVYKICIACAYVSGDLKPGSEAVDAGWFRVHDPPELSERRINGRQLDRLVELSRSPRAPADFD